MTEKLFDRFYEGPEPPDRLGDMVIAFANMYPSATRLDWVQFASEHARECYRSGYLRGFEYAEREPDEPEVDPDELMDALEGRAWRDNPVGPDLSPPDPNDWEWYPGGIILEGDQHEVVGDEPETDEDAVRAQKARIEYGRGPGVEDE